MVSPITYTHPMNTLLAVFTTLAYLVALAIGYYAIVWVLGMIISVPAVIIQLIGVLFVIAGVILVINLLASLFNFPTIFVRRT